MKFVRALTLLMGLVFTGSLAFAQSYVGVVPAKSKSDIKLIESFNYLTDQSFNPPDFDYTEIFGIQNTVALFRFYGESQAQFIALENYENQERMTRLLKEPGLEIVELYYYQDVYLSVKFKKPRYVGQNLVFEARLAGLKSLKIKNTDGSIVEWDMDPDQRLHRHLWLMSRSFVDLD